MNELLEKYGNHGHFEFSLRNILRQVCNAPHLPGIYLVYGTTHQGSEILKYIGVGGTFVSDGTFKNQKLFGRINATRGNQSAEMFFTQKLQLDNLNQLKFEWYVTFDNINQDIPGYIEGLLLQTHFELNGNLPSWNICYP